MNEETYKQLELKNQLCFPMYLATKELVKTYSIFLEPLDLTYTQYLVMMVMWEHKEIEMKKLGEILYLDSNTLTPVLNRLSQKGYISKEKSKEDKRAVILHLQEEGYEVAKKAQGIPAKLYSVVGLSSLEIESLSKIVNKVVEKLMDFQEKNT